MKRAFRAATVFTGAAACAAIAAPAAQAAPLAPGATATVVPDTTGGACQGTGPTDSLVLYYTGNHGPACFAGVGSVPVGGDPEFTQYCAGVWKGYLWIGGTEHAFTAGIHNLYNQRVSRVTITGYNSHPSLCNFLS